MSAIKAVIFDLGNVLVDFDHRRSAARIAPLTHKSPQEIHDLFFDSELTGSFEEGKILPRDFYRAVTRILQIDIAYEVFLPIWNDIFSLTPENNEVLLLSRQLSEDYAVCVLSNINVLHFEYLQTRFGIFDGFHHVLTSCALRMRKPDPLIYKRAAEIIGVAEDACFYTDDRPELIEAARALGMRGYVYRGTGQLRKDLAKEKIPVFSKKP